MSQMEDKIAEIQDEADHDISRQRESKPSSSTLNSDIYAPSINTGPKGVLNDYKIAKERLEQRWAEQKSQQIAQIEKETMTVTSVLDDEKIRKAKMMAELDDEELDRMLENIDAEMEAQYTQLRLKELEFNDSRIKSSIAAHKGHPKPVVQGKTFGELYEITKNQLVDFVENEDPNTLILIHIYQIQLRACVRLSEIMGVLCKMYPKIKWARMMETEQRDFEDDTLPILVAYKSGDVIKSHVRLVDDIGHNFDLDDVLEFLEGQKYLKSNEAVFEDD